MENRVAIPLSIMVFLAFFIPAPSSWAADMSSSDYITSLKEIADLIGEFERELYLTNEIVNLRDRKETACELEIASTRLPI